MMWNYTTKDLPGDLESIDLHLIMSFINSVNTIPEDRLWSPELRHTIIRRYIVATDIISTTGDLNAADVSTNIVTLSDTTKDLVTASEPAFNHIEDWLRRYSISMSYALSDYAMLNVRIH